MRKSHDRATSRPRLQSSASVTQTQARFMPRAKPHSVSGSSLSIATDDGRPTSASHRRKLALVKRLETAGVSTAALTGRPSDGWVSPIEERLKDLLECNAERCRQSYRACVSIESKHLETLASLVESTVDVLGLDRGRIPAAFQHVLANRTDFTASGVTPSPLQPPAAILHVDSYLRGFRRSAAAFVMGDTPATSGGLSGTELAELPGGGDGTPPLIPYAYAVHSGNTVSPQKFLDNLRAIRESRSSSLVSNAEAGEEDDDAELEPTPGLDWLHANGMASSVSMPLVSPHRLPNLEDVSGISGDAFPEAASSSRSPHARSGTAGFGFGASRVSPAPPRRSSVDNVDELVADCYAMRGTLELLRQLNQGRGLRRDVTQPSALPPAAASASVSKLPRSRSTTSIRSQLPPSVPKRTARGDKSEPAGDGRALIAIENPTRGNHLTPPMPV